MGEDAPKKVLVLKTLAEVGNLGAEISVVEVSYSYGMAKKKEFVSLMKALAKKGLV